MIYHNISISVIINGLLVIENLKSIKIDKPLKSLSDTAKIELPREFKLNDQVNFKGKRLLDFINTGDFIVIQLGYDGDLETEFSGYITEVGADIPTVIKCEDEMHQLKRTGKINKTYQKISLKELVKDIAPGYPVQAMNMQFDKFMVENATAYEVLEDLKKYGIRCKFRNGIIEAGMPLDFSQTTSYELRFKQNIRKSSKLVYSTVDQKAVKVKAISIQKGSSEKITYEYGKAKNGQRTLHAPLNLSLDQLKSWTEDYYKNIVFEGYEGSIDGWCYPRVNAGDVIKLTDPNYPDKHRDGKYLVDSVVLTANEQNGIKRTSELSVKL